MSEFSGWLLTILRALLALSLYVFLGWGLWVVWRDIRSQKKQVQNRLRPPISLAFQSAPDFPLEEQNFSQAQVFIGRDPVCECHIPHETVSSRHAKLYFEQGQWWLVDQQSRNGTFLNNQPLLTATVITNGDEIRCGEIVFIVSIEANGINL